MEDRMGKLFDKLKGYSDEEYDEDIYEDEELEDEED